MRILHISSTFSGGAGIAVRRIVESQRLFGLDSVLVARSGYANVDHHYEKYINVGGIGALTSKFLTASQSLVVQKSRKLVTPMTLSFLQQIRRLASDYEIVHFHSMYNVINHEGIAEIAKLLPVVVTLHDQRLFTGACHYSFDCLGYQDTCKKCPQVRRVWQALPQLALSRQEFSFQKATQIQFVSPSKWLAEKAQASSLLKDRSFEIVVNPLPRELYGESWRKRTHSLSGRLTIGFVSQHLNNPYKGLDILLQAISLISSQRPVHLRLFGKGKVNVTTNNVKVEQLTMNTDDERVTELRKCDVIVVPSLQDNLPSSLTESLVCGIPVIASRTGGIREVVDLFGLRSFESGNPLDLAQALTESEESLLPSVKLEEVKRVFSYEVSAKRHEEIYRRALSSDSD